MKENINFVDLVQRKKKTVCIAFLILLVSIGAFFYYQKEKNQAAKEASELCLSGNVDVREVALAFRGSDRITDIFVEEGDSVKKGQLLAKLDPEEVSLKIQQVTSQIEAQENVVLRLKNGTRLEEIAQYAAKLEAAKADQAYAAQELSRKQNAFESSSGRSVSQQDLEDVQAKANVTAAKKKEAGEAYNLALAGARDEDIAEAEAQLKALKDERSRQSYILAQTELRAPSDGVVRSRLLEVGDMGSPQQPVFKLVLNNKKWVRAYIKETDLGKIYEGQKAEVFIDTYHDKAIDGQIGYISSTAEFTPKTVQTDELRTSLLYEIRVYVEDTENLLRMGMPATVKVKL